jgi:hypothetical protein
MTADAGKPLCEHSPRCPHPPHSLQVICKAGSFRAQCTATLSWRRSRHSLAVNVQTHTQTHTHTHTHMHARTPMPTPASRRPLMPTRLGRRRGAHRGRQVERHWGPVQADRGRGGRGWSGVANGVRISLKLLYPEPRLRETVHVLLSCVWGMRGMEQRGGSCQQLAV